VTDLHAHECRYSDIHHAWVTFTREQRFLNNCLHLALCLHGILRSISLFFDLQDGRCSVKKATHHLGVVRLCCLLHTEIWSFDGRISGATPLSTFFALLFLWFCVSVPLVFIGSYFGYRAEVSTHPVRTNQIPRLLLSGRVRKGDGEIELLPRRVDLALTRSRW
jgi:hypothetical protein